MQLQLYKLACSSMSLYAVTCSSVILWAAHKNFAVLVLPSVSPVVWLLLESERSAVVEVSGELAGGSLAQNIDGSGHFFLGDSFIFLLFGGRAESLPRQSSLSINQIVKIFFWQMLGGLRPFKGTSGEGPIVEVNWFFYKILTWTKYMRMYPRLSMSSLRLCSMPRWVLMLAYLAVPVNIHFILNKSNQI